MIALITSVFGGIDSPKKVPAQSVNFCHYHFSEKNSSPPGDNDRMKSLYYKCQMHKEIEADYYVYVDGKIQILANDFIAQAIDQLGTNELAMLKHGSRSCIYEEVDYIEDQIKKGSEYLRVRYARRNLRGEVEYYRSEGYPENNGLNDCCIFIRSKSANKLFDEWWRRVYDLGFFDQTAIQFTAWDLGIKIIPLEFKPASFKHVKHLKVC